MKRKCFFVFFIIVILVFIFANPIGIFLMMIEGSGYVPNKSNIWDFSITQIDEGSGGYWRYGEDRNYYYHFSLYEENVYFYINKESNCPNSNKLDFKTWCNPIKVYQEHSQ